MKDSEIWGLGENVNDETSSRNGVGNLVLGNVSITITSGALIPVLLMLPNIVWMLLPKMDMGKHVAEPLFLTIVENIGRFAALILPFFFSLDLHKKFSVPILIGMGLALAVYYVSWMRYFVGERSADLLSAPLLGLPLPMAVAPIVFLVLSSYLMGSWLTLGASIVFGIAHVWVSAVTL
jgi:hypothetical protein